MFDPTPAINLAFAVAQNVIITFGIPLAAYFIFRKFHIDQQSALGQKIMTVAANGAALGLAQAQSTADADAHPIDIKNKAVAIGLNYLNSAISSKTITAAKITQPLDQLIAAQVSKLQITGPVDTTLPPTVLKQVGDMTVIAPAGRPAAPDQIGPL